MRWSDIPWQPSIRTLRQFGGLGLLVFGGLAGWHNHRGDPPEALAFATAALAFGTAGLAWPRALRPVYVGWMLAAFPIGWVVSSVLLGLLYVGVFAPLAGVFRLIGRDALALTLDPGRATYWEPKSTPADVRRYFRTF
jgi:hypothetical protein